MRWDDGMPLPQSQSQKRPRNYSAEKEKKEMVAFDWAAELKKKQLSSQNTTKATTFFFGFLIIIILILTGRSWRSWRDRERPPWDSISTAKREEEEEKKEREYTLMACRTRWRPTLSDNCRPPSSYFDRSALGTGLCAAASATADVDDDYGAVSRQPPRRRWRWRRRRRVNRPQSAAPPPGTLIKKGRKKEETMSLEMFSAVVVRLHDSRWNMGKREEKWNKAWYLL